MHVVTAVLSQALETADTNGDGVIDYKEFAEAFIGMSQAAGGKVQSALTAGSF